MQRNFRKGITLAEMCIVLAVVAIVSLSVASFATMAGGRGTAAATKLDAMGDLEIVEAIVESWIAEATKDPNNVISIGPVDGDSNEIKVKLGTNAEEKISLAGKTLQVSFPDEKIPIYYYLKSIVGVKFTRVFVMEDGSIKVDLGEKEDLIEEPTEEPTEGTTEDPVEEPTEEPTEYPVEDSNGKTNEKVNSPLYYCTVTYQYRSGIITKRQTYTFCVYPRVGEIVS